MGFSTASCRKISQLIYRTLYVLAVSFCFAITVRAEGIEVKSAELELSENSYYLNATFDIQFNSTLEDLIKHGVPLHFVTEFSVVRKRWYWFDEEIVTVTQRFKLGYNALTRRYRLSVGDLFQNFDSLEEAITILSRARSPVLDKDALRTGKSYEATVRMWMDVSQLPKPFQLNALASQDWTLSSKLHRWTINP